MASLRPELPDPAYGQNYIYAPNIAKLASESTVFGNAYCQEAVCSPSRMSFLVRRTSGLSVVMISFILKKDRHASVLELIKSKQTNDCRPNGAANSIFSSSDWATPRPHHDVQFHQSLSPGKASSRPDEDPNGSAATTLVHLLTTPPPPTFFIFQAECPEIITNFALVGDVVHRIEVNLQKGEALRIPSSLPASSLKTLP